MVDQLPNLGREEEMLKEMGVASIDALFADVPESVRMVGDLPLPDAQSEEELLADAKRLLGANLALGDQPSFLGAGLYRNFVPSCVFQLVTRGEFLTSYTPYQPEVSQGMLQAMWEFQSLISELIAMPITNLSLYDGSTAAAEALTCAVRVHNRKAEQKDTVYISELTPPDRISVIHNYCQGAGINVEMLRHDENGCINLEDVQRARGSCAVYVEQPNPLGIIDGGYPSLKEIIGETTALIVGVQPVSLGLLEAPGNYGADIVIGEGQPLGSPITGGGPLYGIFGCTQPYLRLMPGRIVGRSIDVDGKEAYCLTLSTREQHIRRHRATSNICTNETLIALMGAMHMSLLGPEGLEQLAVRNMAACTQLKRQLAGVEGVTLPYDGQSHFNEFIIELPAATSACLAYLEANGVVGGFDVSNWYAEKTNQMLVTVTDQTSQRDLDRLVECLNAWTQEVSA
ncbi:MAG: aminomethyl-transferring glycine dehydrogenase subunit GcvPA [Candidatus Thermoplasmatota archaeon]|nr:aminomethyl-transferring glycine dehydrogenase subunit GcvPA [Candidatus Thermoplasmatota archaeon]